MTRPPFIRVGVAQHRAGIWSHDAPIPRKWHRCNPWDRQRMFGQMVENCACGAVRVDGGRWRRRNSRRLATAYSR